MNTAILLHKSLLQSHRQCPRRAWLEAQGTVEPQYDMTARALLEQGKAVHAAGRSLIAGLESVPSTLALEDAAQETHTRLEAGAAAVAEAAFVAGQLGVRVDILERGERGGVRLVEIKSGSSVKDAYLDDCAIQYACVKAAGLTVERVEVMHPNTQIARPAGGTGAEVLVRENVTDVVHFRAMAVKGWTDACLETLAGAEPAIAPGDQCSSPNACPFADYCGRPAINTDPDRVELLPSQASDALKAHIEAGQTRISTLPPGALDHPRNVLVYEAVSMKRTVIVREFAQALHDLPFPRFFLDFEAAGFAIPRFDGTRAHQSIPFQWSCHRQDTGGGPLAHAEFLDVTGNDPRGAFAEALLATVGTEGPVVVYSAFERTRLMELALALPDLRDALIALTKRLVDLLALARRGYYAPSMLGSWSLKRVVPTLPATEGVADYAALDDVADGMAAQAAYMEQIDPSIIGPEKARQRQAMLDYCRNDTAALAHFAEFVESSLGPRART